MQLEKLGSSDSIVIDLVFLFTDNSKKNSDPKPNFEILSGHSMKNISFEFSFNSNPSILKSFSLFSLYRSA